MNTSLNLLKNKVILITGSTTGIGAATAKKCSQLGAKVMIHGRQEERAKQLRDELGEENTGFVLGDLDDASSHELLVSETVKRFGAIDGLVNNAGIFPRDNIDTITLDRCRQVMSTNLFAPILLIQQVVKQFRKQKTGGVIVNIGSMNAYCGQTDLLIYSASKGALMTTTRNLADALGPEKIRVNQINVGWTPTETEIALKLREGLPSDWQDRIPVAYAPSGHLQTPADVAGHVVFWLSDLSAPTSGAVYEVEQYPIIGRNRLNYLVFDQKGKGLK